MNSSVSLMWGVYATVLVFVFPMLYRLVRAVEKIADKMGESRQD